MNVETLNLKRYYPKISRYNSPVITIGKVHLSFNRICRPALHNKPYCEIFFDEKQKVMAIKPLHVETVFTKRLYNIPGQNPRLCIGGFLKQTGLFEQFRMYRSGFKHIRFRAIWNNKGKLFLIDLNGGTS